MLGLTWSVVALCVQEVAYGRSSVVSMFLWTGAMPVYWFRCWAPNQKGSGFKRTTRLSEAVGVKPVCEGTGRERQAETERERQTETERERTVRKMMSTRLP